MGKRSAGLLIYRYKPELQVFLVHPGGPFFAKKDDGAWTIPKGEYGDDEEPFHAAVREFEEETGIAPAIDSPVPLPAVKQKGGKVVMAWAGQYDIDPSVVVSNTFALEWPPKSGSMRTFPEIDKAGWFSLEEARKKINTAQVIWLDYLQALQQA
ncbi:Predicted NTP pyrophosphohydrolase, NUDIX family [Parapedobacter luteus]|uniref:Predicted NTP pyrophosphohydrolase, NUDIX family n=1 Tax=Parapedobacter luteus TaxID=623280 RepID=A0A1T5DN90_9SPHI|nr:NUDIX domain-containing protein [Parapedobacter luteus]SKB73085.1 Predicted NTP pyrophosphohydrolase, NUDIX family [Parapedobacter luteus]